MTDEDRQADAWVSRADTLAVHDHSRDRRDRGALDPVGAYAIVIDGSSRILLCRIAPATPSRSLDPAGGGVNHGEHPNAAVLRELREETGLEGTRASVARIWSGLIEKPMIHPGPLHWIAILYRVTAEPRPLRLEQDGSSDQCAWFTPDEVAAIDHVDLVDDAMEVVRAEVRGSGR